MTVVYPVVVVPNITNSRIMRRFCSVELDTSDVDGSHRHVSSAKFEPFDNKSTAPTQCSRLRPNFHLKDSSNENSEYLVHSVAPLELGQ